MASKTEKAPLEAQVEKGGTKVYVSQAIGSIGAQEMMLEMATAVGRSGGRAFHTKGNKTVREGSLGTLRATASSRAVKQWREEVKELCTEDNPKGGLCVADTEETLSPTRELV
jgi:hypothetical protein